MMWAHRFATGLPCRASSRAASRPCSLRCAWPAAWLRIASLRAGIPCAVLAAGSGAGQPWAPWRQRCWQCAITDTGCRAHPARPQTAPESGKASASAHPPDAGTRAGSARQRPCDSPDGSAPRTTAAVLRTSESVLSLSVISNCGKSAPARVKARRRPGCWQPDSHGRWRSLRIGAAVRPAPLAASSALTRGSQGFANWEGSREG